MSITVYKLTKSDHTTRNGMTWDVGKTNRVEWGGKMCAAGCLHAYRSLKIAVLAMPIHCADCTDVLVCTTPEILDDDGLKVGCDEMTGVRWVDLPVVTTEQRVEWAIRCSLLAPQSDRYRQWAANWLDGTDRSAAAAAEAEWAAEAARAAKWAAEARAAAEWAAKWAAEAARAAARAAEAAEAARAAAEAAEAARAAARAAAELAAEWAEAEWAEARAAAAAAMAADAEAARAAARAAEWAEAAARAAARAAEWAAEWAEAEADINRIAIEVLTLEDSK